MVGEGERGREEGRRDRERGERKKEGVRRENMEGIGVKESKRERGERGMDKW